MQFSLPIALCDRSNYFSERPSDVFETPPLCVPGSNTAAGLNKTTEMIKDQGRHHDGVPVVVIFLTDVMSYDESQTEVAATNLHATLPEVKMSLNTVMRATYFVDHPRSGVV